MKVLNIPGIFLLLIANAVTLNVCNNSSSANKLTVSNNNFQQHEEFINPDEKTENKIQDELNEAKKAGKAVFVVVTGTGVTNTEEAVTIANEAKKIVKRTEMIQMNRDDVSNKEFVNKWRLSGAPLPIILVISPKGYLAGGRVLAQSTPENIAEIVPSPKYDEVYEALNNQKPIFLVLDKSSFTDRLKILENCKIAASKLANEAAIIEVDLDDSKEAGFIKKLKFKEIPTSTTVIVINKSGQTTATYKGNAEVIQLIAGANKVIKSSCCAPGSSSSCEPKN